MNKIIEYFLSNSRLNYTLAAFILVMGIFAYNTIAKERFPSSDLDEIKVSGSYLGASANSLNSFAVTNIESELENISGIKEITTTIKSGRFDIKLELNDGANKSDVLNNVKDALDKVKSDLPSDMTEPTASASDRVRPLIHMALNSKSNDEQSLSKMSEKIENSLLGVDGISSVDIAGEKNMEIDIDLDNKKITLYGLNTNSVVSQIKKLSYMFPVANVEQKGNHIYMSADNDKFDKTKWRNTMLTIGDKKIYLSDIANISIGYPTGDTIARLNGSDSVILQIFREDGTDSISIAKQVRQRLEAIQKEYKDVETAILFDESTMVSNRLSIIISNITLGLILVGFSMYILISARLSFVIVLGIPFSFIIGLLSMEYLGISLNMTSLAAMLMALGIVVDDAIIVSENIQRYLDYGLKVKDAVLKGTKEMIAPVLIAAITTIFAFMPMLFLSGRLGATMKFVPIVISILIIASLLESFLFLPLHAKHALKPKDKVLDWSKAYDVYEKVLHLCIHHKKAFLFVFFVSVPIATFLLFQASRFQFFPMKGSTDIIISVKLDNSMSLEQSDEIAKKYEKILAKNKDKLYIDSFRTTVGRYRDVTESTSTIENAFMLNIELQDLREDSFLANWINPILTLSFDFERKNETRLETAAQIRKKIRKLLFPLLAEEKNAQYNIVSRKLGPVRNDIELRLSGANSQKLQTAIDALKTKLGSINGVTDIADNMQLGDAEYRYSVNNYGQGLGLNDEDIALSVGNYFRQKDQASTYDDNGIVKIKTKSIYKDSIAALKNFYIPVSGGKFVALNEVVSFNIVRNFEKIEKIGGKIFEKVYANVNVKEVTANEALQKLQPVIKKLEDEGVSISFGGEVEKTKEARSDLTKASLVAIFLIFLALLINFPSYKNALILLSVIPFTIFGALLGHFILGINLAITSIIGILGLAGVVINDGIVMLDFLQHTKNMQDFYTKAKQRVRPIFITSITTFLGLATLIFFPTADAAFLQPIAVSLGFGIAWGTILNLVYVPTLYATIHKIKP